MTQSNGTSIYFIQLYCMLILFTLRGCNTPSQEFFIRLLYWSVRSTSRSFVPVPITVRLVADLWKVHGGVLSPGWQPRGWVRSCRRGALRPGGRPCRDGPPTPETCRRLVRHSPDAHVSLYIADTRHLIVNNFVFTC